MAVTVENVGQQIGAFANGNIFTEGSFDVGDSVFDCGGNIEDIKVVGNCRTVLRIDFNAELFQGLFVALVFALVKTAVGAANLIALMQANLRQRTHSAARDAAKTDFSHCYSPF